MCRFILVLASLPAAAPHAADDSVSRRLYDEADGGKADASAMSTGV
jgi:hypothetical protein